MKKILIFLIIIVVMSTAFLAIFVKNSNTPVMSLSEVKENNSYISYLNDKFDQYFYYSNNMDFKSLKDNSDLVIKVTCNDLGVQNAYSILRECMVEKVLFGNYEENYIYIYEPSYVDAFDSLVSFNGYINMEQGNTYVLFLKKVDTDGHASDESRRGYYLTSAMYGKYKLNKFETLIDYKEGDDIFYNTIKEHETILVNKQEVDIYNDILKKLQEVSD